ncbi:MAG TPA: transglycosylase domain-containing protein [Gaiellaceae bacterium]|nr:transglycosylase domain-containing protein [Gaiellaceae bacterium]
MSRGSARRQDDAQRELARLVAARRARRRRRPSRRWVATGAAVVACIVVGTVAAAAFTGRSVLLSTCNLTDLRPVSLGENSFLYDRNGSMLGVVASSTNRQPLQLSAISKWLPKATVAIEDRRFWQHGALDFQGIARAMASDVQAGHIVQGGSTITQELVRNLYIGHPQKTVARKLREACLAEKLAQRWSKREILAAYVNEVFYGSHAFGAQAGAQTFFSTSAQKLTLPQAALLAGLPQAPSVYDPFTHPDRALGRRNAVLAAMLGAGYITRSQYSSAVASPLGLHRGTLYSKRAQPNFFGWAQQQLVARFGASRVRAGGLQVRTTLDPRLQRIARDAAAETLPTPGDPAAALVAIDPRSGAVRAMVSWLPDHRKMQFNLASQAKRSTGSAFKPITLATALSQGASLYSTFYGPSELHITAPDCSNGVDAWDVHNDADESAGTMNLLDATANSVNTIFAQLIAKLGPKPVVRMAHRLGIKSPLKQFCAITLGSVGVSPLELTNVYATFAARGVYHPPQAIAEVTGPKGNVVGRLDTKGKRVLSPSVADRLTYALEGVISHGTGRSASIGRPAAGKTGTAENYQDAWFCGYVPQLATCVWIGYPKAEIPLEGVEGVGAVYGGTLPAEIWRRFMTDAVGPLPELDFHQPADLGEGSYLSGSGTYSWSSGDASTTSDTTTTGGQTTYTWQPTGSGH